MCQAENVKKALYLSLSGLLAVCFMLGASFKSVQADSPQLMVFGDSLVAGYGLPAEEGFTRQLQDRLTAQGVEIKILNAGVSGDTTAGGLARLEWALAEQPDYVMIVLGGNDLLRGLDPQASYENLNAIINRLKDRNVKILLAGMQAPRNLGADYAAEFDRIYPALAAKHDI
ncbi:MAG: arylesterase, partial [Candidatus Puniceispirillaceae bacterium]